MEFLNGQKVLCKKIVWILKKKKNTTVYAIITLFKNLEKTIDNKLFVSGRFIDLQKALDSVDHKRHC